MRLMIVALLMLGLSPCRAADNLELHSTRPDSGADAVCSLVEARLASPHREAVDLEMEAERERILRQILDVVSDRIFSLPGKAENGEPTPSIFVSRRYSTLRFDVESDCEAAMRIVEDLLWYHDVEIGVVGIGRLLGSPDLQSSMRVGRDSVVFVLTEAGADKLLEVTSTNLGRELYVKLDDHEPPAALIPIRMSWDQGRIVVDKARVPERMLKQRMLPFPMVITDCRACGHTTG